MKRTLKRLDLTARSFFAFIEPGSAFAGSLFELALAADRSYMLDDPDAGEPSSSLSPMNGGLLPMSNGLSRLQATVSRQNRDKRRRCSRDQRGSITPARPPRRGSSRSHPTRSTGTTRCGSRSRRARRSRPDALTGLEANLRFAGPETMETKIFGRLTAWQNWIFQRPNAVGDKRRAEGVRAAGEAGVRLEADVKRDPRALPQRARRTNEGHG